MSIIRLKSRDKFVVIDKKPIEDAKLSWQAKGLLTYLLSKPNDWQVHINQLSKASKNGRDSTRKIIQELVDSGYIIRNQVRNDKGHLIGWDYLVCEESISEKAPLEPIKPKTENPTSDNPKTVNPTSENRTLIKKDLPSNELLSNESNKKEREINFPTLSKEEFQSMPESMQDFYRKMYTADTYPDEEVKHLLAEPEEEKRKSSAKKKSEPDPAEVIELPHGTAFAEIWEEYKEDKKERKKKFTTRSQKMQLKKLENVSEAVAISMIEKAIAGGWATVYAPEESQYYKAGQKQGKTLEDKQQENRDLFLNLTALEDQQDEH